jgi:tricorn protease
MLRISLFLSLVLSLAVSLTAQTRLMRYPDISRDQVVFVYAGDLWTTPRAGGVARRLTSHPGDEVHPKFSPDGKWIAFTGEYDGNSDVFVIPAAGGEPRRLTFHPGNDRVLGWTPDSKTILFRSNRNSLLPDYTRLFTVPVEGGVPEMLSVPRASLSSFSPDATKIAFNSTSQEFRTWKRYRGGWTNTIGIFDLKTHAYEDLPKNGAHQQFPMWHSTSIYFISDKDGFMNLYRYDMPSKKTSQLTTYKEYDVKWPSLGPDSIIYENGGLLFNYEIASGKIAPVPVTVHSDLTTARAQFRPVASFIRGFAISPTGARAVLEAHGDIFTLPGEKGNARNLTDTPGVHEQDAVWSPDGKWIAYLSDKSGEFEIYTRPQLGGEETRITTDGDEYRQDLKWSPDSKMLLYTDKRLRLWYVDLEKKAPVLVDHSEYRSNLGPNWSPDSRWIVYRKPAANQNDTLWLYNLEQKKSTQVTNGFYNDRDPVFDENGKYLYFMSDRFFYPTIGNLELRFSYFSTGGIFAMTLKADEASPFAPQSDEEKTPEAKKADEKKPDDKAAEVKPEVKPIQIDLEGLGKRISQVPLPPGIYSNMEAGKDKFYYVSSPMETAQANLPGHPGPSDTLHVYDVVKREDKVVISGIDNAYNVDKDGKKLIYRSGDTIGIIDASGAAPKKVGDGKINLGDMQVRVDPREEWKEILHEAWRIERDYFWDPAMGGVDWNAIEKRYAALLPWVAHRSDLSYIIGEMIGELAVSHTYVQGGDFPRAPRVSTGMLGADFAADGGFFRVAKIYPGENWNDATRSPLTEPGLKVKEGNYLISVNGVLAKADTEPYAYFQNLSGKIVTLKINDKPSEQGAWDVVVKPIADEGQLRYFDWVENNRRKVEEATGGRIAYMHVPDTQFDGVIAFDKYLQASVGKEGLIVDERYNHGGFVPDFYIEKLKRKVLFYAASREGKDTPTPGQAIFGPKVMIVNELSGSGGDAFPWFFQHEKVGPIVGERTWGGLIGYSRTIPMLDGGTVTAPEVGFWSPDDGKWVAENHGVDPEYVVEERADLVAAGHDPQLEKAIALAMDALKSVKPEAPKPKFPSKVFGKP